jgi:hypothetical protein
VRALVAIACVVTLSIAAAEEAGFWPASEEDPRCNFCQWYRPVGPDAALTLDEVYNESHYYAACKRNVPPWLYHRRIELENQR